MSRAPGTAVAVTQERISPAGFRVWRPGLVEYRDAQALQDRLVNRRRHQSTDLLVLLEHPPVITFGRKPGQDNLLWTREALNAAGIDCVASQRGGDVTLHGPGQLVGYPIVDLNHAHRDLHRYLRQLETILTRTLADFDLAGTTLDGKTGVWVEDRKIASIGIAVRHWISYHGFALNIDNDLSAFRTIVPCGLPGVEMTSMRRERNQPVDKNLVADRLIGHFSEVMQRPLLGDYDDSENASQT